MRLKKIMDKVVNKFGFVDIGKSISAQAFKTLYSNGQFLHDESLRLLDCKNTIFFA